MENIRDMNYFMDADLETVIETECEGIDKIKYPDTIGDNEQVIKGLPIPWVLKPITTDALSILSENNTTRIRKGGRITKTVDETRLTNELLVDTIIFPNFKDKAWLNKMKCIDPVDLLMKVLSLPGDYARISQAVTKVNGMEDVQEEIIKSAKN